MRGRDGRGGDREVLGPGDVLGELALLDAEPRSPTIVALEPVEVVTLAREGFLEFTETHDEAEGDGIAVARRHSRDDELMQMYEARVAAMSYS